MHSLKRDKGYKIFSNIFLLLLVAVMVLPFVLLFMSSITEDGPLVRNGYSLFPEKFSLEAYRGGNGNERAVNLHAGIPVKPKENSRQKFLYVLRVFYHAVQWRFGAYIYDVHRHFSYQKYNLGLDCAGFFDERGECAVGSHLFYEQYPGCAF